MISDKRLVTRAAGDSYHLSLVTRHTVAARCGRQIAAACLSLLVSGCSNLDYYWQSVSGQLEVWRRERPIENVISDPAVAQELKDKLARVLDIRAFASRDLRLPDNSSYQHYADLGRPFVVWNVYAAPEFSVQPLRWCFLIAGCVSYRGYFSREAAERFAAELAQQGHDVYVGGVPAYSTLGRFADPVLNTFIQYPEADIARLIFHELAHQVAYAKDDTVFNESFAVVVEQEGVRRWLVRTVDANQLELFERNQRARVELARLVHRHRNRLDKLYHTRLAPEAMRERKREIFAELEAEYLALKAGWGGYAGYDNWFARKPNNAQLASVGIYTQLVPAFEALLEREGRDLARFYAVVKELAAAAKDEREARMRAHVPPVSSDK